MDLEELAVPVPTLERLPAVAPDLTACPAFGLEVLATEEMDDLEPFPTAADDLVATEVRVETPLVLLLEVAALLTPADLEADPRPLLVVEPVAATLGL